MGSRGAIRGEDTRERMLLHKLFQSRGDNGYKGVALIEKGVASIITTGVWVQQPLLGRCSGGIKE